MTALFFDTETTGKWNFKTRFKDGEKWECPTQPKLVQLAALLVDDDFNEVSSLNCIIHPTKWEIPEEAANIHGITQEKALRFGVSLPDVLEIFLQMAEASDKFVAHNSEFDVNVMRHACFIAGETEDPFEGKDAWCTMKAATPVVKILHANPRHDADYKYPKLEECVRFFFNRGIDGAHDALVDVRECVNVYKALCEHYGMKY